MTREFHGMPRVISGPGALRAAGGAVAMGCGSVMVVHSPSARVAAAGVVEALAGAGVRATAAAHSGEPTVADVDRLVEAAGKSRPEGLVGIGGGSALDVTKAVAAILANGGKVMDYLEIAGAGKTLAKPALPWTAVPTTAGTGSEGTRNAVITAAEHGLKASLRGNGLMARLVILDPSLLAGLSARATAAAGMDAISQLIEAMVSAGAQPMTDVLAEAGLRAAWAALPRMVADRSDTQAVEAMQWAALQSGVCLSAAGLGAVHGLASPLGGQLGIGHGTACARLLGPVVRANLKAAQAGGREDVLGKYARVAGCMGTTPAELARVIEERVAGLPLEPLPPASAEALASIASAAVRTRSIATNPVKLGVEELQQVLREVWAQGHA